MDYREALKIFGLTEKCSEDDIKKKYRKLGKLNHPDLGGSEEKMKRINEAKEILDKWVLDKDNPAYSDRKTSDFGRNQSKYTRYSQGYSENSRSYNRGGAGGAGGSAGRKSWADEWYREERQRQYTGNQSYNASTETKEDTGKKKPRYSGIYNKIKDFEQKFGEAYNIMLEEAKNIHTKELIVTIAVMIILAIVSLVLLSLMGKVGFLANYSVIVLVLKFAVIGMLAIYYIPVIVEKVTNLSAIPDSLEMKINIAFTNDGAKVMFRGTGDSHGNCLFENSMSSIQWDIAMAHWCNLVDSSYVGCVVGASDGVTLPMDTMIHKSSFGKDHPGFKTPEGSVYISSVGGYASEFVLVIPGAFICCKDNEAFVIPMTHASIEVAKKQFNRVSPNGGETKTTMYEMHVSYDSRQINIIYSKSIPEWRDLTV